jgi:histidine triad (HIT) family protein
MSLNKIDENLKKDCIFCKIIKKELSCYKIYENNYVLAFLDINPSFRAHTLVIPKKHFTNIFDCEDKYLEELIKAIKLISKHYKQELPCQGANILNASGKVAEQSVFHFHFHIIPRFSNDNFTTFPKTDYKKGNLEDLANKLKL